MGRAFERVTYGHVIKNVSHVKGAPFFARFITVELVADSNGVGCCLHGVS